MSLLDEIIPIYCDFDEESSISVETVDGRVIGYPETWKAFRVVHYRVTDDEERSEDLFYVYLDRLDREDVDGSLAKDNPIAIYHGETDFRKAWSEIEYNVENGFSFEMPVYCFADRQEKIASNAHRITGEILGAVTEPYNWLMKSLDDLLAWYDCWYGSGTYDEEWLRGIISELESERRTLLDYSLAEKTIRAKTEKVCDIVQEIVDAYKAEIQSQPDIMAKPGASAAKVDGKTAKVDGKPAESLPKLAINDDGLPF